MTKKIAILRGINVGGKRKILMADLRALMEQLGFSDVRTYIQSGNVFFSGGDGKQPAEIADLIAQAIEKQYGFSVPVIVRTTKEIAQAIENNPFNKADVDIQSLHLTFLKEKPDPALVKAIADIDADPDRFQIKDKNVFIFCPGSYHKTKLSNNFFEKKIKTTATTRNWKTVLKLLELSNE